MIAYLICTTILLTCISLSALFHFTNIIAAEEADWYGHLIYFKTLIGITGSMSLIILISSIYYLNFYCRSALKYSRREKKLNASQRNKSDESMNKLVENNLKESVLLKKKSTSKSVLKKYKIGPANIDNLEESDDSGEDDVEVIRVVNDSVLQREDDQR